MAYPTIKNYSIEKTINDKFEQINADTEEAKFEPDYALNLANTVGQLLSWFMQFIGVGLGLVLVIKGEIRIGTVIAAQSFANDLGMPLQDLVMNINSIHSVKALVKKFHEYSLEKKPAQMDEPLSCEPEVAVEERIPGDGRQIEFSNVSLWLEDKTIIDHFSFCFEKKQKVFDRGIKRFGKKLLVPCVKEMVSAV